MALQLSDALFSKLAGWEAMKSARALLAAGQVLESHWQHPRLHGRVRDGATTYPAGLLIRSPLDADNLCPCRNSRLRGLICAHSVAVGLHQLHGPPQPAQPPPPPPAPSPQPTQTLAAPPRSKALRRAVPGQPGEPLELCIILPPNLPEALAKGKLMLCLEGRWRHGRTPLNALPPHTPFQLSEADLQLLDALESLAGGDSPALLLLPTDQWSRLLPLLVGHPRVTRGKQQPVEVLAEPFRPAVRARLEPNGTLTLELIDAPSIGLIPGQPPWHFDGNSFRPLDLPAGWNVPSPHSIQLPRRRVPLFLNHDWPKLAAERRVEANFHPADFTLLTANPQFNLHLAGGLALLQAKIDCSYHGKSITELPHEDAWLPDPDTPTRYLARNLAAERDAIGRLLRAGFAGPDSRGLYHLKGQDPVLAFFARDFPQLEREWRVTLEERLQHSTSTNLDRLEPKFQITPSGEQWFDLDIAYSTRGGERLSTTDIQQLLRSGQTYARRPNGKFVLLDTGAVEELQEVLLDCDPRQVAGRYRINQAQAGFLHTSLRQSHWTVRAPADWQQLAARQHGELHLHPPPLGPLDPILRPYQKTGVAWLRFLRTHHFGGILADEMGLGKTLQVLAHLAALQPHNLPQPEPAANHPRLPALIVCPTSLVSNWAAESTRFTPHLKVLTLHGPQRHQYFANLDHHDLVITSYALLRRDAAHYHNREFDTVVLDEAQHIKNRQTQNAQTVKAVRARHHLVLTGTPLENSVLDLWSIFDFLMPGYLGSAADFRERYELPIARDRDTAAQQRLARRLRPFLLRRLKREVAADLPPKIEQVSFCELTDDQRAVYQQVLESSRREVLAAAGPQNLNRSRMLVLTALLRLRQICCDLRLLPLPDSTRPPAAPGQSLPPAAPNPSGKLELFTELLDEVLDGGHRVLVFSQFTRMLRLLREDLAARQIGFSYLDGDTQDRARVVEQFQQNHDIPVFLISLKAGGVGLNLTAADTIIHFDPWWNPAVENQATDRAHRLGQNRIVTSYKLITRGTVEEKILHLQSRKRGLLQGMLGDEEQLAQSLSWDEIQDLLTVPAN